MKKTLIIGSIAAAAAAAALQATPIGLQGQFNWARQNGYYTGSGGEFTLLNVTGGVNNDNYYRGGSDAVSTKNIGYNASFETFCLETGENAANPSYYTVNSKAISGDNVNGFDNLSKGTAWLYSQFAQGTLNVPKESTAYGDYFSVVNPTRDQEAGLLQNAIWALEDEIAAPAAGTNPYYDAAMAAAIGGKADAAVGEYGVYVLNNYSDANRSVKAQDFLYYNVPDGGATVAMLGMGLIGLGCIRRKLA